LYREEEREMLPLCADLGVGVLPWSPLAPGAARGRRAPLDDALGLGHLRRPLYDDASDATIDSVANVADEIGETRRRWRWPGCCGNRW
jgi:aryl-alcohol dehydrogenase (NADP+)